MSGCTSTTSAESLSCFLGSRPNHAPDQRSLGRARARASRPPRNPRGGIGRFDLDYYLNVHMPMSIERLSVAEGFRAVSVGHGVSVGIPDLEPAYVAICDYLFDSFEALLAAFNPHTDLLQEDIANYTDVEPVIQVSDVDIHRG
jgi:uncharacterized protein (TIGR02118 family)